MSSPPIIVSTVARELSLSPQQVANTLTLFDPDAPTKDAPSRDAPSSSDRVADVIPLPTAHRVVAVHPGTATPSATCDMPLTSSQDAP